MSKAQELLEIRKQNGGDVEIHHFEQTCCKASIDSYYEKILSEEEITRAVEKYNSEFDEISIEFAKRTKLSLKDGSFLILAVALQCLRQYLLSSFKPTVDEKATKNSDESKFADKTSKLNKSKDNACNQGGYYFAKFDSICFDTSVPYDTIAGSKNFGLGLGGTTHRYKTLGHDPILGYIFGTMNILTNTLTTWDLTSFHIRAHKVYSTADTARAFESMMNRVAHDPTAVAAALIKQTIHIKSDMYTPNKIPFPILSGVSPDLSETLAQYGVNHSDVLTVGKQALFSMAINTIIAMLHRLLIANDTENDEKLFEVRTRKILLYSNLIATSSNVIYCGFSEDYRKFDLGGFAVTMQRLFSDTTFIDKVKYEFLNSHLSSKYEEEYKKASMYYAN
ncbi:MAG: hypothetical protein EOM51_09920 [Clostridia bacterium]|nr:hypothetical protein [Clostridia bacterium]